MTEFSTQPVAVSGNRFNDGYDHTAPQLPPVARIDWQTGLPDYANDRESNRLTQLATNPNMHSAEAFEELDLIIAMNEGSYPLIRRLVNYAAQRREQIENTADKQAASFLTDHTVRQIATGILDLYFQAQNEPLKFPDSIQIEQAHLAKLQQRGEY